ncbi:MAG: acyl-CoA thioesterase [Deltaproteobacteria bacterium]|nr:MAG: acyl-CoA thioesterase [Deltaproteobacteria bacterium]
MNVRRKKNGYFESIAGMPDPLTVYIKRRVKFSEVDVMGIVWHGRYPEYFEEGSAELGRRYGLSYKNFHEAQLRAPIVQLHIDHFKPLFLDEEFTLKASLIWNEGARLNTEYSLIKDGGDIAATGYTVQMFIDGKSSDVLIASPKILEECRRRWKNGEFS